MRHRIRTKQSGLVTHATPDGKAKQGEREVLHKKYQRGTINSVELRKYVNFLAIEKKLTTVSTSITVKFGGKNLILTISEYETFYVPAYGRII